MHNPSLHIAPQTGITRQTQHPNAQREAQSLTRQQPLNRDLEVRSNIQENLNTLLTSSDHQNVRSRIQLSTHTYDQLNIESEDENQDPKRKGRGCNKEVDHPADTLEERVWIVPLPDGDWPIDSKIVRIIGHIIRHKSQNMHLNWSSVPRAEKLHYLAIFQSIYQWDPEYDLIIKTRWETQMKTSSLQGVAGAKKMYDKGKRIEWLADDFLKQLERHWTSETFSKRSESCKRNPNSLACGTFTGGSRSSNHIQIKKGLDFCDNYEDTHMTIIVKKGVDGRSTITSKIWVDPRCEDIVNIYKEECTNKFGDRELWPKEVYADGWINAAKPKKNKVVGIPKHVDPSVLGFPATKRSSLFIGQSLGFVNEISELKQKYTQMEAKYDALMEMLKSGQIQVNAASGVASTSASGNDVPRIDRDNHDMNQENQVADNRGHDREESNLALEDVGGEIEMQWNEFLRR